MLWLYLIAIQFLTFGLYWFDKRSARKNGWRVPEGSLLLLGLLGGTVAAIAAMHGLRHKNRKNSYQWKFWLLTILQIIAVVFQPEPLPQIVAFLFKTT